MITSAQERDAKEKLQRFISETVGLLRSLVNEGYDSKGRRLFMLNVIEKMRPAWEEFEGDFDVQKANSLIQNVAAARLQSFGLYGKQLDLKLAVIAAWTQRFSQSRLKKILLKLLDAIDTLLDSLIAATGIDEALKEIKDILRDSIDDDDEP
jgi:DUF1009 family protein